MHRASLLMLMTVLLACSRASSECKNSVQLLRSRVGATEWSHIFFFRELPYADIPKGDGRAAGGANGTMNLAPSVVVDGDNVRYDAGEHPFDDSLDKWLHSEIGLFNGPDGKESFPLYLLATARTRVGAVRRVAGILRSMGEVRLAMRPTATQAPFQPRKDKASFFAEATRRPANSSRELQAKWINDFLASVVAAAGDCSQAVEVSQIPGMSPAQRLARVPDAFEKCACRGDMETTAALYWFAWFDGYKPIRWHPWDEALVASLGDDASYAELAVALSKAYVTTRPAAAPKGP